LHEVTVAFLVVSVCLLQLLSVCTTSQLASRVNLHSIAHIPQTIVEEVELGSLWALIWVNLRLKLEI
jgi:hypothetical protein